MVFPEVKVTAPRKPAIFIAAEDTGVALQGDKVVVRLRSPKDRDWPHFLKPGEQAGKVIKILERGSATLTGTLQRGRAYFYVASDDPRIGHDIIVQDPAKAPLKPPAAVGDKVVVKLNEWKERHLNPDGVIIERLGRALEPRAELLAIYQKYDLAPTSPATSSARPPPCPTACPPRDTAGRLDYRQCRCSPSTPTTPRTSTTRSPRGTARAATVHRHPHRRRLPLRPTRHRPRPRGPAARQLHLPRRHRGADAAGETLQRPVLARRGAGPALQGRLPHLRSPGPAQDHRLRQHRHPQPQAPHLQTGLRAAVRGRPRPIRALPLPPQTPDRLHRPRAARARRRRAARPPDLGPRPLDHRQPPPPRAHGARQPRPRHARDEDLRRRRRLRRPHRTHRATTRATS
jgi:hypothetical protein